MRGLIVALDLVDRIVVEVARAVGHGPAPIDFDSPEDVTRMTKDDVGPVVAEGVREGDVLWRREGGSYRQLGPQ